MKICVLFPIVDAPNGGGNQFLKLVKRKLIAMGMYAELESADIVLFNSHQVVKEVIRAKKKYPEKIFIHRIDGPMRLYNQMSDTRDNIVNLVNQYIADGTVFQSEWSREKNYKMGLKQTKYETVIYNAADKEIFNSSGKRKFDKNRKIRLIATSWSDNMKKGFKTYLFLDQNLDWKKYEMIFVGNSPVEFKNIKHIQPLNSIELAKLLKESDIYISASEIESCSNAIIEAMSCALPVICKKDGGNPELVKNGGKLFEKDCEIITLLEEMADNYDITQKNIEVDDIDDVVNKYIMFMKNVKEDIIIKQGRPKHISIVDCLMMECKIKIWRKLNV